MCRVDDLVADVVRQVVAPYTVTVIGTTHL